RPLFAAVVDGVPGAVQLGVGRLGQAAGADEQAHRVVLLVEAGRPVRAVAAVQAAALVHVAVRAHHEAVADVAPAVAVHVLGLELADVGGALLVRPIRVGGAEVVEFHAAAGAAVGDGPVGGAVGAGTPLGAGDELHGLPLSCGSPRRGGG